VTLCQTTVRVLSPFARMRPAFTSLVGAAEASRAVDDGSSSLAPDGRRAIPDRVIDAMVPPSGELCATTCVETRTKPGSQASDAPRNAWSVDLPLNEVIFSKNDSTYDVGR
jgi:hypothetical protein